VSQLVTRPGACGQVPGGATEPEVGRTDDPNVLAVTGRWAVLSGTGAYENLSGTGTVAESIDTSTGVIQGTWQGEVLFH
jgi:hypothetical protein